MRLNLDLYGTFIPSWEGNTDLPKDEQIVVSYKRITGKMASGLMKFNAGDSSYCFDNSHIVEKCVTLITNLEDNDGNKVDDAKKLLEAVGTHGLVTEIGTHILHDSKLKEELGKKNQDSSALV